MEPPKKSSSSIDLEGYKFNKRDCYLCGRTLTEPLAASINEKRHQAILFHKVCKVYYL
jgi:hypothetical protein